MASSALAAPIERVLDALHGVKPAGSNKWVALCPAHDDHNPSLSIKLAADGRILVNCHRKCATLSVVTAIGLTMADLAPPSTNGAQPQGPRVERAQGVETRKRLVKTYDYVDLDGRMFFQACRYEPKDFNQRQPTASGGWAYNLDGITPVLYRLPQIVEAVSMGRRIYIVEGEKDADALWQYDYPATTSPMGAGKWRESYADVLAGANVVILPDNDDVGRAHAVQVAASLHARDCSVKIVTLPGLPPKGDVSDWLAIDSNDLDALEELIDTTPRWNGGALEAKQKTRWRLDELWQNEIIMRPPPPVVPYLAWAARATLLAAREKSGKSTLTGFMAARVSTGGDFLGEPCQRGRVLILGLEEYIGDTARRLKEFGADGRMVQLVDRFVGSATDRPSEVRAHLEAVDPILVILDSLITYAAGVVTDANNATQTQAIVQGLADLSHATGIALVIIHHARKADGKYRDSSAIGGAVDIIAEVFPPEDTERTDPNRRRVRPIGRVPARSVDFRFTGSDYQLVDAIDEKGPLDQRILAVVSDRPGCSVSDVVQAVDARKQEVTSRITHMIAGGLLLNDGDARKAKLRRPVFAPASSLL